MSKMFENRLKAIMSRQNLSLGVCCGEGSFGHVYKVYDSNGNLYGVVKAALFDDDHSVGLPSKESVVLNPRHSLSKEYTVLTQLVRSPHVARIKTAGLNSAETDKKALPVFSAGDNEAGYFIEEALISLDQAEELMSCWINAYGIAPVIGYLGYAIASALLDAQKKWPGFSHRDLKPSNIFIRLSSSLCMNEKTFVLGDFGISNTSPDALTAGANIRNRLDDFRYPADEIPSIESDVYSLGAVLAYFSGIPFNSWGGKNKASDLGDIGKLIEKMLSVVKEDRPPLHKCAAMFGRVKKEYSDSIDRDEKVCASIISAFNTGNPNVVGEPLDKVKTHRYNGISHYLKGDYVAARAEFGAADDTISRFYLASMAASVGKANVATDILLGLKNSLEKEKSNPVYDNILAMLYSLGYHLSANEQVTAKAVLMRSNNMFSFL